MYRVLVVDDHHILRTTILAFLQTQSDIQIVGEAVNGQEAVQMARSLEPDIVVIDISMPVMNGIEATRIIKRNAPGIRIIGMSAFDEAPIHHELEKAGAETCLNKSSLFLSEGHQDPALLAIIRSKPEPCVS